MPLSLDGVEVCVVAIILSKCCHIRFLSTYSVLLEAQEVNFKSQGLVHFTFFLKLNYRNLIVYELNKAYKVDQ